MTDVESRAADLTAELVGIDSVNPGLVPGAAGEVAIVRHLEARLSAAGFTTTVVEAADHAGQAEPGRRRPADPPGRTTCPTVVLNGHVDTVGVSGMPAPFTARSTATGCWVVARRT